MCKFFSLISDGKGNIAYFDWEQRQKIIGGELGRWCDADSHTSLNDYYGLRGEAEDKCNKYEYNPLTGKFIVYMINTTDDSEFVKKAVHELDFKTILEPLIIKPVVHPFRLPKVETVTEYHISLLHRWVLVWRSAGDSLRDLIRSSVMSSVGISVWDSVRDSVLALVEDSALISAWDSAWNSVGASVGASIGAYISSFFNIKEWRYIDHEPYVNPFQCCIELWDAGLVPSYDGKIWRLHSGKKANMVWQGNFERSSFNYMYYSREMR